LGVGGLGRTISRSSSAIQSLSRELSLNTAAALARRLSQLRTKRMVNLCGYKKGGRGMKCLPLSNFSLTKSKVIFCF
jgi:hypothetical protein